ncbi:hypothetical protein [Limnothrix sp. FACHB-708]|uniref:hypothetical protein n=1 Tax=Limnothrix sp. FACHB-708 TaxID=2692818 RepID=UPI00168752C3|nr:hypothetical protein [Limnothrix sp. FACHB-708]
MAWLLDDCDYSFQNGHLNPVDLLLPISHNKFRSYQNPPIERSPKWPEERSPI